MKRLKFKGKKIEKNKFKGEETLTVKNKVVIDEFNQEYDGFVDVVTGRPHGEGTLTVRKKDKTLWKIEEGIWQNGFLTEGSETTYFLHDDRNFIKKEIGKWRFDKDKNFCEECISGKGEELYYRTKKDLKDNKYFGYIKGTFDNGSLLKGEVYNASLIKYSDEDFVKKIIVKGKGEMCSKAVAVSNILTERMLKETAKFGKIDVDSEMLDDGQLISTIKLAIVMTD